MTRIFMTIYVATASSMALVACQQDAMNAETMAAQVDSSAWPASEEAVVAAPQNHNVLYEDENIRFLSVSVRPGEREPMHHHTMPSVLIIDSPTNATDHFPDGTQAEYQRMPPNAQVPSVFVTGPEPAHSYENTDSIPFHLYRLEFKNLEFDNLRGLMEQFEAQMIE